jgi:hypothetical protein
MNDAHSRLWPAFQRLANEYPDSDAVKLTLEMQRWFVHMRQLHFLHQATSTSLASIANQRAAPPASTAPIENSTAS